jgi:predicted TIM-barrel fold metal-dependent hydrolase
MKKQLIIFLAIIVFMFVGFIAVYNTKAEELSSKLKGRILLQVESKGEAWYVNPKDSKRYYMADGAAAYNIMRDLGVGVTNKNLEKIKSDKTFAKKQQGKIFLQVESKGEAYYIDSKGEAHYLKDGEAAYSIMRELGLGIKTSDLDKINLSDKDKAAAPVSVGGVVGLGAEASSLTCALTDTAHMDIFDSHVHISSKISISQIISAMDKAGVSVANLYSGSLETSAQYPGRFITFVDTPDSPQPSTWLTQGQTFVTSAEAQLKTGKFYGIGEANLRYYTGNGGAVIPPPTIYVAPDTPLWLQLVNLSARYHVPISFHFIPDDSVANAAFERMLSSNKNTIFIWAHLGFNNMTLDSATLNDFLLRYPNLYLDTAGIQNMQNPLSQPNSNWARLTDQSNNGQLNEEWRQFFETWNSRILFGSDAGGGANGLERWLNYTSNTSDFAAPNAIGHWTRLLSNLDYSAALNILSGNARALFLKERKSAYKYSVPSDGQCYSISVSSHSSISALTFNPSTRAITFTAAGSNGTTGQAVISIPIALAGKNFTAAVDGQSVKSQSTANSTSTTISLEYAGGIRSITLSASTP